MENKGKYYITTAIAYASGKPHIGNTYEIVMADAIARYKKLAGYDVFFQTGTDEHGQKIEEKAKAAGMTPKAFVDEQAAEIKRIFDLMNTSYNKFIRTTDDYHEKQVQKIFRKMYEKGDIYKSEYEGWYCTPDEAFWTDSQVVKQEDGTVVCPECGRPLIRAKEEAYFFRMSKYADRLLKHIEEHPEFIQPESRKNEMVNNFLKPGLQDLCVSRTSFKWGIPVDFDDNHVVYVWLDALSNYITGIGYDCDGNSSDLYKKLWPADLHLIGKDIIRFHTIYWPIFLMSLDEPLPKQVFGHPWMLVGEDKISKSRGNAIYADDLVRYFGVDAVRYYVLHEMPFAQDGTITWELIVERINSDLANVYGNLVSRTLSMVNKYFEGHINKPDAETTEFDLDLIRCAEETVKKVDAKMDELRVGDAIEAIFDLLRRCNKYIDETEPWKLAKDNRNKVELNKVLYNLCECIRIAAVLLSPFTPETSEKVLDQLDTTARDYDSVLTFGNLEEHHKVAAEVKPLFARLNAEEVLAQIHSDLDKPAVKHKDEVTIDDFGKLEIRVGTVKSCEKHPSADKLLVFKLDFGAEERQIVSGIAKWYKPEELVGKKVAAIVNLKPVKLRGVESQGMILSAEDENGELEVVSVDKVANGAEIR